MLALKFMDVDLIKYTDTEAPVGDAHQRSSYFGTIPGSPKSINSRWSKQQMMQQQQATMDAHGEREGLGMMCFKLGRLDSKEEADLIW